MEEIRNKIQNRTLARPALDPTPYLERFLQRYGNKVVGVFMYGSVLSQTTATATSFPDFFVITDGYRRVFRRFSHWLWAYFLPPHIFHLRLDEARQCKYNLISFSRFRRECSGRAKDIYILGRFSKRVSLIYARDPATQDRLVQCCENAMHSVVPWALRGMEGEWDATELAMSCLNISYAGETRVEADSKVPKLFASEEELYLAVYPGFLERDPSLRRRVEKLGDGRFRLMESPRQARLRRLRYRLFIKQSQIRGILRWPKFLITVDEWLDIILAKIERAKGIRIVPTPRQRRHPLIFGWPHFFRLLREGAISTSKRPTPQKR